MATKSDAGAELKVSFDGKPVPMNPFVRRIIASTIAGLISALRGGQEAREIVIRVQRKG